jgi:FADH2 O2-dependent halogenase
MSRAFDLAILGSGFAGSLLAQIARKLGRSVLLLERGTHPRFAIGESTSPLTNLLLEELAIRYDLPRLLPLTSYGAWKRAYPEVAVGLKRGFSFYAHTPGQIWLSDPEHRRQLLVAASPNDEMADTHWYRPDFDHFLVREAQELGVEYVDRVSLEGIRRAGDLTTLRGTRSGHAVRYEARYVVDASGMRGALSRLLDLPEGEFPSYPRTRALFSHFTGVGRFEEQVRETARPPYRPDDAALHHVFPGGWMWVLRFDNGITSAGFAVEDWLAEELGLAEGEPAWRRFLDRFPAIREQFAGAQAQLPFIHAPRLSYRCGTLLGDGWALLPSAASFVDPLFSTGFPLTLLGIQRLAAALEGSGDTSSLSGGLAEYAAATSGEACTAAALVGASYASFPAFEAFADLSMLYFVAASYSEMARRLERPDLAPGFLLRGRPEFREAFLKHTSAARAGRRTPAAEVHADMEAFNIAGLCNADARRWDGVDLEDVVRGAGKLEQTPDEVRAFIRRMGW